MAEVIVLSDEEFYEYKTKEKRKDFLKELESMSKSAPAKTFSVKNVKKEEPEKKERKKEDSISSYVLSDVDDEELKSDWGEFVTDLESYSASPIESITDENIVGFQLDPSIVDNDLNKYNDVFKKELAMLSEVLKDVKAHGNRVDGALKKMNIGGKGASSRVTGIPKGYSDLVEAYNSINTTKIQVIKAMSDLRSKQIDWQFKDKANNPSESESVDNIADMYYKKIVSGGANNFIANSMNAYQQQSNFEYDTLFEEDEQGTNPVNGTGQHEIIDSFEMGKGAGFNITQPIVGSRSYQTDDTDGDEFGYITNENSNYDIVAYQYGDGHFQFAAIDEFGEPIEGIELPSDEDPDITSSLKLRPGSNFVYDKYGRSYKVVEMGGVDISDIDDMDYPY